jgi:hypothetical protein
MAGRKEPLSEERLKDIGSSLFWCLLVIVFIVLLPAFYLTFAEGELLQDDVVQVLLDLGLAVIASGVTSLILIIVLGTPIACAIGLILRLARLKRAGDVWWALMRGASKEAEELMRTLAYVAGD